jgi:hypothetical protein
MPTCARLTFTLWNIARHRAGIIIMVDPLEGLLSHLED